MSSDVWPDDEQMLFARHAVHGVLKKGVDSDVGCVFLHRIESEKSGDPRRSRPIEERRRIAVMPKIDEIFVNRTVLAQASVKQMVGIEQLTKRWIVG